MHLSRPRPASPRTRAWLWLMVALVLLKAAVPGLARLAADQQGLSLGEVCSVHGVRTAVSDALRAVAPAQAPDASPDAAGVDCPLAPVLASVAVHPPLPAVVLHAPLRAHTRPAVARTTPRPDAAQQWLTWRLHAPPVQG